MDTSGILCAVLGRVPWPRQVFAHGDNGRQRRGWHSTRRWERRKRRRKTLTRSRPGKSRHIREPREKHKCQRYRRNERREPALAGPPQWFAEVRGGS